MSQESPQQKALRLVRDGVSARAAAHASGLSPSHVARLVAQADASQPTGPFTPGPQGPPQIPPAAYGADQPVPPLEEFRPDYHGHTFKAFSAPLSFNGFDLARVRRAISLHRQGFFYESSTLSMILAGFGPVYAALKQRVTPWQSLPKKIVGGTRGLARLVRQEIEDQVAPNDGLSSSPYFPASNWGCAAFEKTMMGFGVWQHVYGDPDPETGVRPIFTRPWPTWATQFFRYRHQMVAVTSEGPVDILNDGKFTLIADTVEPHFFGAIVVLGEEVLDGKATQRARASYIERYGNPKWVGEMPKGTAVRTPEGDAFLAALNTLRSPDSVAIVPADSKVAQHGLESGRSTVMKDALESNIWMCAATILGSDGTISRGTGGVYSAPVFAGVRRDIVDDDKTTLIRSVATGHIDPYVRFNYAASIAETRGWVSPRLEIPLPDPDRDQRIKSYGDRLISFHKAITEERLAGFVVDQERADQVAAQFELSPPRLTDPTGKTFPHVGTTELKPDTTDQTAGASGETEPVEGTTEPAQGDDDLASEHTDGGGAASGGETKDPVQSPGT